MPGLLGYYDPRGVLMPATASRMARALHGDGRCREVFAKMEGACMGAVDRGVFPAAGEVLTSADGSRKVCFQGAVVGFSGEEEPPEPRDAARRCFCTPLDADLLSRAVGSFVAVVLDTKAHTLEIVTDRHGTCPAYYAHRGDLFLFASQQKALLATGRLEPELDPVVVGMMLQIGMVCGELTLLKEVRAAPPGAIVRVGPAGLHIERYHVQEFAEPESCAWDHEVDRLAELLGRAVGRSCGVPARIGVPVSGGLDSRTLLALAPDPSSLPSFTFGLAGCRDLRYGTDLARALRSPHHAYAVQPAYLNHCLDLGVWLTEGLLGANHFHILPHVEQFSRHCDVVLDGIGGDVILGGKYVKRAWTEAPGLSQAGEAFWSWLATLLPADLQGLADSPLVSADALAEARSLFQRLYAASPGRTAADKAMSFGLEHRTRRLIGGGLELLRWRVESLQPFFDNDVVEAVARLPHSWRRRSGLHVAILKRASPLAAKIRWQHTNLPVSAPYALSWLSMASQRGAGIVASRLGLPPLFTHREMSDFRAWFRGPLQSLVRDTLLAPRSRDRGLISPDLTTRVVEEHMRGRADHSFLLGVLLALEVFSRQFIDDLDESLETFSDLAHERPCPTEEAYAERR